MKMLVTGAAGFIGYYTVLKLLEAGHEVVGLDSINDYYEVGLKHGRLKETGIDVNSIEYGKLVQSEKFRNYKFIKLELQDKEGLEKIYDMFSFNRVCHLAAQAGVRYSIDNPRAYIDSNISGFLNILECCRNHETEHLVYASSSSVYGLNEKMPFSTSHNVDHPVSLYAATKKSNELMAHAYSCLYNIPVTGLRFFTVYGPWGRPDMAYYKFTKAIYEGQPIDVYNKGNMMRDFTYIDDIVEGVVRVMDIIPKGDKSWSGEKPDPSSSRFPYKIYNIGNNKPVKLLDFIKALENAIGKNAVMNFMPMQPGDVLATFADVDELVKDAGFKPSTIIDEGIGRFVEWYRKFYTLG
ncbi:MAG: NAD-dependent epimerase [Spirochaetota bacterium]